MGWRVCRNLRHDSSVDEDGTITVRRVSQPCDDRVLRVDHDVDDVCQEQLQQDGREVSMIEQAQRPSVRIAGRREE